MKLNFLKSLTLEDISLKSFLVLLFISSCIVMLNSLLSAVLWKDNFTLRGASEEIIRLAFTIFSYRLFNAVCLPNLALAFSEFIMLTFVFYIIYEPNYYSSISINSFVATWNVACISLFSIMSGMLYKWFLFRKDNIYWVALVLSLFKITFYKVDSWIWNLSLSLYGDVSIRIFVFMLIMLMAIVFYRRNKELFIINRVGTH